MDDLLPLRPFLPEMRMRMSDPEPWSPYMSGRLEIEPFTIVDSHPAMQSIPVGFNVLSFDTDTPDISVTYSDSTEKLVCRRWFSEPQLKVDRPWPNHRRGILQWYSPSTVPGYETFLFRGEHLDLLFLPLGPLRLPPQSVEIDVQPDAGFSFTHYYSFHFYSASGDVVWLGNNVDGVFLRLQVSTASATFIEYGDGNCMLMSHDGGRLYDIDSKNNRLTVLVPGAKPRLLDSEFRNPRMVVVDVLGRTVVADAHPRHRGLFAFDSDTGGLITSYRASDSAMDLAYNADTHAFMFSYHGQAHLLPGWTWLPVPWSPARARCCSPAVLAAVRVCTQIRSLWAELVFSLLPNEMLFEIFALL